MDKIKMKARMLILAYAGLLLLITLVFFACFLSGAEVFAFKDLSRYFYPLRYLMVEQVKAGHWPLWNPYIYSGMPLLATHQIAFFYPLTLIYYLLPFTLAFNYYIILHYFLAASFMFLLMRHFKARHSAAFLSAVVFAFSGYMLSVSNMNTSLSSVIWLPLAILLVDRLAKDFKGLDLLGLSVVWSLMFLGGEPTILYASALTLFIYIMLFSEQKIRAAAFYAGSLALMFLLCAAQWLPFLELARLSDRVELTKLAIVSTWSFPLRESLNFVLPYFFGNPLRAGEYSEVLLGKINQLWLISPYLGFFPLFFAGLALFRPDRRKIFWALMAVFWLLLAFGKFTPLYIILHKVLPGLALIRFPVKFLFLIFFSLSLLSGFGWQALNEGSLKLSRVVGILTFFLALVVSVFLLIKANQAWIFAAVRSWYPKDLPPYFAYNLNQILYFNLQSLKYCAGLVFLGTLLSYAYFRKYISQALFIGLFLLLIVLDLWANNSSISSSCSVNIYDRVTPNISYLKRDKDLFRYYCTIDLEMHNRSVYGEKLSESLLENKDKLVANRLVPYHLSDLIGYESVLLKLARDANQHYLPKKNYSLNMLNLSNVKYIASLTPHPYPGLKLIKRSDYYVGSVYLYQNLKVLPRAFLVYRAVHITQEARILDHIDNPRSDPSREIVLEENIPPWPTRGKGRMGKVAVEKYASEEIWLNYSSKEKGFLFLSDSYYPGWNAYVDGKPSQIYRANYRYRAILAPAGEHKVKFIYDPWSFKLGLIISGITLLSCGIYLIVKSIFK